MANELIVTAEPGSHAVTLTRAFDAPAALVFKAHTDPEMVKEWWGLRENETIVDELDARKGGCWRFVQKSADGEFAFNGVFHDVTPNERIVYTFEFEGMPGHVLMETLTFEERDGKTYLTDLSIFQSVEDRDGMVSTGMADVAQQSMVRLDEILAQQS